MPDKSFKVKLKQCRLRKEGRNASEKVRDSKNMRSASMGRSEDGLFLVV